MYCILLPPPLHIFFFLTKLARLPINSFIILTIHSLHTVGTSQILICIEFLCPVSFSFVIVFFFSFMITVLFILHPSDPAASLPFSAKLSCLSFCISMLHEIRLSCLLILFFLYLFIHFYHTLLVTLRFYCMWNSSELSILSFLGNGIFNYYYNDAPHFTLNNSARKCAKPDFMKVRALIQWEKG